MHNQHSRTVLWLFTGLHPEATAVSMVTVLSLFIVFNFHKNGLRSISCINNGCNHCSKKLVEISAAKGHMHTIYYKCKAQGKQKNYCTLTINVLKAIVLCSVVCESVWVACALNCTHFVHHFCANVWSHSSLYVCLSFAFAFVQNSKLMCFA